jgi:protein gp37
MSKIEWTERTWNFLVGCDKISAGCKNCYAIRMAYRLMHNPKMKEKYEGVATKKAGGDLNWTGKINVDEERLLLPLQVKKPTTWFVNSMSDLFHQDVPFDVIDRCFTIMKSCPQHTFQILTKRADRMLEYFKRDIPTIIDNMILTMMIEEIEIPNQICLVQETGVEGYPLPNVWLGVSVEDQKAADERIPLLLQVPAAVRWLSCEPLLGKIDLDYIPRNDFKDDDTFPEGIDWVVCGGESGPGARPMHPDWARSLRDQCNTAGVPFFFKQWGEWMPVRFADAGVAKAKSIGQFYKGKNDFWEGENSNEETYGEHIINMRKVGKKKAGRLLDGKEWSEYPVSR